MDQENQIAAGPLVSVVIPCYNYGRFIGETIQSVLNQTHRNLEVMVVDDGSTDNTKEAVSSLKDARICYSHQQNSGVSDARKKGIERSRGEYIAFLDADDLWLPEKLEKQLKLFDNEPEVGLIYCLFTNFESDTSAIVGSFQKRKCYSGNIIPQIYRTNPIGASTPVVKRKILESIELSEINDEIWDDWALWTVIARVCEVDYVPEQLTMHRIHGGGPSYRSFERSYQWLVNYYEFFARRDPYLKKMKKKFFSEQLYDFALNYFIRDRKPDALRCLATAIHRNPLWIKLPIRWLLVCISPKMTQERYNESMFHQKNGLIDLFSNRRRLVAMREFIISLSRNFVDNRIAFLGVFLCIVPNQLTDWAHKRYFDNIFVGRSRLTVIPNFGQTK